MHRSRPSKILKPRLRRHTSMPQLLPACASASSRQWHASSIPALPLLHSESTWKTLRLPQLRVPVNHAAWCNITYLVILSVLLRLLCDWKSRSCCSAPPNKSL